MNKDKCTRCAHRERCDFRALWFFLWLLSGVEPVYVHVEKEKR